MTNQNWKQDASVYIPSFAPSTPLGLPQRSSMIRLRSAALRSCSFFNSSAAFLRSNNYTRSKHLIEKYVKMNCEILFEAPILYSYIHKDHNTYTKFLLSFWCHKTFLCFFGLWCFFHTLTHFSTFAFNFGLFGLLCLFFFKNKGI